MYARLILLSKLIILLSIAPAKAQYSFAKVFGGSGDDRPIGVFQLSNGSFILYGDAESFSASGFNYVSCIDKFGKLIWEKYSTNSYGSRNYSGFESVDGYIYIVAASQHRDGTPYLIKLTTDGTIVFDTVLSLQDEFGGSLFKSFHDDKKRVIVSLGSAGKFNFSYMMFHKMSYDGKVITYKFNPWPTDHFLPKGVFKVKNKEEYLFFSADLVMRFDSIGNQIGNAQRIVEADLKIEDIVQNEDGTFTSLGYVKIAPDNGYHLRKHNEFGLFDTTLTIYRKDSLSVYYTALTLTKDKGYLIAGSHFTCFDSTGTLLWNKYSGYSSKDMEVVDVGQALDGGFYGCAVENRDFDNTNYNMYMFKTTAEGIIINAGLRDVRKQELKASITPNPSDGRFTINGEFKLAQVSIRNLLGQEVLKDQVLSDFKLDATALETGVYFIVITSGEKSYTQKIAISK